MKFLPRLPSIAGFGMRLMFEAGRRKWPGVGKPLTLFAPRINLLGVPNVNVLITFNVDDVG